MFVWSVTLFCSFATHLPIALCATTDFAEAILRFCGHHSCRNFSSCRIQSRWWVVITVVIVGLINNVPGWRIIKMVVMGVDQDQLHANRGKVPQLLQSLYI